MKPIAVLIALFLAGTAFADRYRDAVDHPGRPAIDREDDDRRKPAQVMAFAGVSAGETVLEVGAGRGYTTELTARLVGPDGTVYAHGLDPARVVGNRLPNVMTVPAQPSDLGERFAAAGMKRGGVDRVLAFFSLHDGYLNDDNDMQDVYRTLLDYMKPGGELIVLDNTAPAGSELAYTSELQRIDDAFLKADILKAGFVFVSESSLLRNPDDDLQSSWFDDTATRPAGYQDRFAFRFRKP